MNGKLYLLWILFDVVIKVSFTFDSKGPANIKGTGRTQHPDRFADVLIGSIGGIFFNLIEVWAAASVDGWEVSKHCAAVPNFKGGQCIDIVSGCM